jgi:hypothetical protein
MYKELLFQSQNERGVFLYTIGEGRDASYLTKTASSSFHPQIAAYIESAKPIEGKTQVLLTSLGAGEYWGSNVNGDYFPQDALKHFGKDYGHKTFEYYAKVYKHHVNKDPKKSYGDVLLSVWNDQMKRVELVVTVDHAKAPDLIERINNGEHPEVSMGCKVPYDVCSICGNKAKTRAQYCDHLRYSMNKVPPGENKKAYAINLHPKFFDISFVLVGADRIAKVLKKIASVPSAMPSMEKQAFGLTKAKVAARKKAEIEKQVPSNTEPNTVKIIDEMGDRHSEILRSHEKPIPKKIILRITSTGAPGPSFLNKVLSTITSAGIAPKPREFQTIALRCLGKPDLAEEYERSNNFFNPFGPVPRSSFENFSRQMRVEPELMDNDILKSLIPILANRSYARPHLSKRVIHIIKLGAAGEEPEDLGGSSNNSLPLMGALTALYLAYGKKFPESLGKIDKYITKNPMLAIALGAAAAGAAQTGLALTGRNVKGKYDFNPDKKPTPNLSWSDRINQFNSKPLTKTSSPLALKLFGGVPAIYAMSGAKKVQKAQNPYENEGLISKAFRKYPMELSTALVASHFLKKPKLSELPGMGKKLFKSVFTKKGELSDDIKSHMLYTLAFPGKSMVTRGVSMMTDLGIMKAMENAFSSKKNKVGGYKQ